MLPGQQEHALSGVGAVAKRLHTPLRLRRPPPAPTNRKPPRASEHAQPPLAQTTTEPPAAAPRTASEGQARQGCRRASVGTLRQSHPSVSPPLAAPDPRFAGWPLVQARLSPTSPVFTIITFFNLARSSTILCYIFISSPLVFILILALSRYYYLAKAQITVYRRNNIIRGCLKNRRNSPDWREYHATGLAPEARRPRYLAEIWNGSDAPLLPLPPANKRSNSLTSPRKRVGREGWHEGETHARSRPSNLYPPAATEASSKADGSKAPA